MNLKNLHKIAVLFMLLGSENSVKVFNYLGQNEIQEIITAIMDIHLVSKKEVHEILNQFLSEYNNVIDHIYLDNESYITKLTPDVLPEENLENFLNELIQKKIFFEKIEKLKHISEEVLANILKNEHPYIITTILFFLDRKCAANVISFFNVEQQSEIIYLLTDFKGLQASKILKLNTIIDMILQEKDQLVQKKNSFKVAMEILNAVIGDKNHNIVNNICKNNIHIGKKIFCETFIFENIIQLTDESILLITQNIDYKQILIALYRSKKSIQYKFYKNVPFIKEQLLILESDKEKYISYDIILNARKLIVSIIKKLLRKKKISIIGMD